MPAPLASFVGREREVADIAELLRTSRLVTLTGPPGVGKSRLAVHVGAELVQTAGRAVSFVDLAPVAEAGRVAAAVAHAVTGEEEGFGHRTSSVAARLDDDEMLLVVDNCEHVIDACADAVEALLRRYRGLHVLATSREPLPVSGAVPWRVAPLSLPEPGPVTLPEAFVDSDAVRLFCERATADVRGFTPSADNVEAIADICRQLDGLPLAIELAAAHLKVLTPDEIAGHLDQSLDLLVGPERRPAGRHRSLGMALESSWQLLSPCQRALLRRLSVFSGTFSREATFAVGGQPFAVLSELVDKSLVMAESTARGTRYRLLVTIRRFAVGKLAAAGEADAVTARHGEWFADLVGEAGDLRRGPRHRAECLQADHDNLRVALQWAISTRQAACAVRLALAQVLLGQARGDSETARKVLEQVLPLSAAAPPPLRARLLRVSALVAIALGDFAVAGTHLGQSLAAAEEAGDAVSVAAALAMSGFVHVATGDAALGLDVLDRAVALARTTGDDRCVADGMAALGRAKLLVGDVPGAHQAFSECRDLAGGDDRAALANAALGCGWTALTRGHYDEADSELALALDLAADVADPHARAVTLAWSGELARRRGQHDRARSRFHECRHLAGALAAPFPHISARVGLGRLAQADADLDGAHSWFDQALALARSCGFAPLVSSCLHGLAQVAQAGGQEELVQPLLEEALAVATGCSDKAAEAQALDELARMLVRRGEHRRAITLFRQALALGAAMEDPAPVADSLEGLGAVEASTGGPAAGARLLAAAESLREQHGCVGQEPHRRQHEEGLALARQGLDHDRFNAEWSTGSALSIDEAVTEATRHGRRRKRPLTGWEALTPTERDVAALAAEGLSNEAIAKQLVVSRRTVETHLQRTYTKLGIKSRTEVRKFIP